MKKTSTQNKSQKRLEDKQKRTATITLRTTPEIKADLKLKAKACKQSLSNYIYSQICGYEPKSAMTPEQEHKLDELIAVRRDRANISNALKGMGKEARKALFNNENFMRRWKDNVDAEHDALNELIKSFTKPNAL